MNNSSWISETEYMETLEEVETTKEIERSGLPIFFEGDKIYIDDKDRHNLVIGSTGSGKTQAVILPMLKLSMNAKESFLVNDPHGELYQIMANSLKKKNYNVIALNFGNPVLGNNWNPLTYPYEIYKNGDYDIALGLIEELGYYIFMSKDYKNIDPFWINSTISYFTGLVLHLFENAKEEEINLTSVGALANQLQSKETSAKFLEELPKNSVTYIKMVGTLKAPSETKGSILSVFNQKIERYLSRTNLSNMLSKSDFEMKDILNNKTAIFVISGMSSFGSNLIPLLTNQIIHAANFYGKSKKRINILLDEFDTMVPIKDFSDTLNRSRGLNIRFTVAIQSYIHLLNMYSKEELEILKMCFGNIVYLLTEDKYTLEEIASRCGTHMVNGIEEPLISLIELKTLKPFETIILTTRMLPLRTKLTPDYKINWGYEIEPAEIPQRKNEEIHIYEF